MPDENIDRLALKIARLLKEGSEDGKPGSLTSGLESINERLDRIERQMNLPGASVDFQNLPKTHPSQQKFDVAEAVADKVSSQLENEQVCTFEPNRKPCDHCLMCSSRGF